MWRCKLGFITRLKKEPIYRRRFYLTLALCFSYTTLGCVVLQIGTALLDLMGLFDIDLEAASWLLSARYIGFLAGCVLFGILFDKFNRLMLMFVCSVGMGVTTLFTPYLVNYPLALALRALGGVFSGALDTGCNTILPSIWGAKSGPYMQLLYLSYTIGGFVSPLIITEPFMAPKETIDVSLNDLNKQDIVFINNGNSTYSTLDLNMTNSNFSEHFTSTPMHKQPFETDIEYAFILTTILCAISCFPYAVMGCKGGFDIKAGKDNCTPMLQTTSNKTEAEDDMRNEEDIVDPETEIGTDQTNHHIEDNVDDEVEIEIVDNRNKITGCSLKTIIFCVAMISALYSAAEQCMGDYIVTFCLYYFNWGNQAAASINSLYWLVSFLGGIGGVILVQVLSSGRLLLMAHICWVAAFIGATVASVLHMDSMLWIYVPISGFFMVQIVPASISWTEESVCKVTGKIMAVIMFATGFGLATNPAFVGYMMQIYSYACFVYILMGEALLCFMFFLIGYIVTYIIKTKQKH